MHEYIEAGYDWGCGYTDFAKYFDTVNHDKLMGLIHKTVKDRE